jgi:hypothetical protein
MGLAIVNAIWIGPELGVVHVACLKSFLRHGHQVVLHCYEKPKDVPDGVELADASRLLPIKRIFYKNKNKSVAGFADLLRYELLGLGLGLYVDCDVFYLRPIEDADYILPGRMGKISTSPFSNCRRTVQRLTLSGRSRTRQISGHHGSETTVSGGCSASRSPALWSTFPWARLVRMPSPTTQNNTALIASLRRLIGSTQCIIGTGISWSIQS